MADFENRVKNEGRGVENNFLSSLAPRLSLLLLPRQYKVLAVQLQRNRNRPLGLPRQMGYDDPFVAHFRPFIRPAMQHEIEIEVRYYETDGQGIVHHANYFQYFELGRVKMLKAHGYDYAELEREGIFLVVHSISGRYHLPAKFGDTLRLVTIVERATPARLDHSYQVFRAETPETLLAEGKSTIACVTQEGVVQRMPDFLQV